MITRELASKIVKELSCSTYEFLINKKNFNEEIATQNAIKLYNHCLVAGKTAEKIAEKIGVDIEKAYIYGVLHDIGRFNPERFYGIVGYEIAIKNNNPDLARICITHVFPQNKKIRENEYPENEFKKQDIKKTEDFLLSIEYNDYDLLIRLCDFISIGDTLSPSKIEDRILDMKNGNNIIDNNYLNLKNELNEIKKYFDKKAGQDLYELLKIKEYKKSQDEERND